MKNICFFNSHTAWGGGEKWHYEMALRLRQRGYPVLVVTNTASELAARFAQRDVMLKQIRISPRSFLNPCKLLRLRRMFQEHQIQTIFLNLSSDLKAAGIAAKLAGVEKIIYRRGVAVPIRNSLLNRWIFTDMITAIIANSEETRRMMLRNNPTLVAPQKFRIISNGIDLNSFDQEPAEPLYPRQLGEILLGSAGRLTEEKGHVYLIELAQALQARGIPFKLLIAGKGKLEGHLQDYTRRSGVATNVIFLGFVEQINRFLHNLDIFLLPSRHEGAANVLLEAMAARKPVVAFQVSSNPEIILQNETGLLAEPGNIADFIRCVEDLISNVDKRRVFGENARKRVEVHFDIHRTVTEVVRLIEE